MPYIGDFQQDSTGLVHKFSTRNTTGEASAFTFSTGCVIYKGADTTPSTAGITLTTTFDSIVGFNHVQVDLSSTAFYAAGLDYACMLTSGSVNSVDVSGETLFTFSIENRFSTEAAMDALGQYGVSTVTTGNLDTAVAGLPTTAELDTAVSGIPTTAELDTALASTQHKDNISTALASYGVSTVSSAVQLNIATTALETHGASTHTSTDVFDQSKNAFSTLGIVASIAAVPTTAELDTALASTQHKDNISTALQTYGGSTHTSTDINDEVLDVLTVDTFAEPAQGIPAATNTLSYKLGFIYKSLRNRKTATSTSINIYNDDTTTIDHKRVISESAGTYDEEEIVSGP